MTASIGNWGEAAFSGSFCAAAFDADGNFIDFIDTKSVNLQGGFYNDYEFTTTGNIVFVPGQYQVALFYKTNDGDWTIIDDGNYNNLGALAIDNGNYGQAKQWLEQARQKNTNLAEANANLGLLALQQGDLTAAENYIGRAAGASNQNEALGNLHLAQGKYAQAERDFGSLKSNSAALAQLMNNNYAKAAQTLDGISKADGITYYLKAILNARQGNASAAQQLKSQAIEKYPWLSNWANEDLEFGK